MQSIRLTKPNIVGYLCDPDPPDKHEITNVRERIFDTCKWCALTVYGHMYVKLGVKNGTKIDVIYVKLVNAVVIASSKRRSYVDIGR